jgi:hypothetical protein
MAEELVQLNLSPIFHNLRPRVEGLRDGILTDAGKIMRREEEASIRQRWYRTGATLGSLQEQIVTEGNHKSYRLSPTTFYAIFGEYGTGRRGAATGAPAPSGYRYGQKPGMVARRYSRIAVARAQPQIEAMATERLRSFNMTVN